MLKLAAPPDSQMKAQLFLVVIHHRTKARSDKFESMHFSVDAYFCIDYGFTEGKSLLFKRQGLESQPLLASDYLLCIQANHSGTYVSSYLLLICRNSGASMCCRVKHMVQLIGMEITTAHGVPSFLQTSRHWDSFLFCSAETLNSSFWTHWPVWSSLLVWIQITKAVG